MALPCSPRPSGALCIHLVSNGRTLEDVIGYVSASSWRLGDSPWRLVLHSYTCNPGPSGPARCAPIGSFAGPDRRGAPPLSVTCRQIGSAATVTSPSLCHIVLAQEMATHGDWTGFYRLSQGQAQQFTSSTWLCISEQTLMNGSWATPVPAPTPLRACKGIG